MADGPALVCSDGYIASAHKLNFTMASTIDLRSDTVTRPTDGMRAAMAAAPVGDDQYGEDPSTNRLQARMAELLGKEAALWLPTGTMANQVALRTLTRPGDEVIASRESHLGWHEVGGAAANAGVQIVEVGARGLFTADELRAAAKPRNFTIFPTASVVAVENTHNRAGGIIVPQAELLRICETARELGLATFLDGARLWNVSAATGAALHELAAPFDLVAVAFSKGLGAPGGSLLAGSRALIASAHRQRHRMGGAMRQNGVFSAAALYALDHHVQRLGEDHANARALAEALVNAGAPVQLELACVQTNIVVFHLPAALPIDAPTLSARARERGVLVNAMGARTVRAVTHLDVNRAQCEQAAAVLVELLGHDEPQRRPSASPVCYADELEPATAGRAGDVLPSVYRAIVEQASEAVILADPEGTIRLWNRGAENLFGYSAAEALGANLDLIIPERFRAAHWQGFQRAIESGQLRAAGQARRTRSLHKDGRKLYVELSFALARNDAGKVVGSFAIGRASSAGAATDRTAPASPS